MALEAKFSKEQILELYLNKVYFGGGAYGIDSASRKFFSHSARELSTAEAAIIAGLVKAPSRYSPTADVDAAVGRANVVLEQMRRYGAIGAAEAAAVDVSAVKLREEAGQNSARYFTDYVLPQLDLLLPEQHRSRADRGLDHARPGHAARGRRGGQGQRAGAARRARWSASTATARSSRWSAATTTSNPTTTARPTRCASRARRGSCSSISPRSRPATRPTTAWSTSRSRSATGARATRAAATPARSTCAPRSPTRSTPSPRSSATRSASRASPGWRGGSASPRRSRPIPRWCSAARKCG